MAKHLVATPVGRDFEGIPNHAITRVFTEGVRRTELTQMQTDGVLSVIDKFAESHRLLASNVPSHRRIRP